MVVMSLPHLLRAEASHLHPAEDRHLRFQAALQAEVRLAAVELHHHSPEVVEEPLVAARLLAVHRLLVAGPLRCPAAEGLRLLPPEDAVAVAEAVWEDQEDRLLQEALVDP